jgi:hypothetical protein
MNLAMSISREEKCLICLEQFNNLTLSSTVGIQTLNFSDQGIFCTNFHFICNSDLKQVKERFNSLRLLIFVVSTVRKMFSRSYLQFEKAKGELFVPFRNAREFSIHY